MSTPIILIQSVFFFNSTKNGLPIIHKDFFFCIDLFYLAEHAQNSVHQYIFQCAMCIAERTQSVLRLKHDDLLISFELYTFFLDIVS